MIPAKLWRGPRTTWAGESTLTPDDAFETSATTVARKTPMQSQIYGVRVQKSGAALASLF
jgi:hypothetical protein